MSSKDDHAHLAGFMEELRCEILQQAQELKDLADGDLQDGFGTNNVDQGWVTLKGMSWGFRAEAEPEQITMTFGPDWPFVGAKQVLIAEKHGDRIIWRDRANHRSFERAKDLASFGLESLAGKTRDSFKH